MLSEIRKMETLSLSSKQNCRHKQSSHGSYKDLFVVSREGTVVEVDSAIQQLKENGGNINTKNVFGFTPLHIAIWRNHVAIVKRLLDAGAYPDCKDEESGWSSVHRALHFGHIAVASVLLQAGASLTLEDFKGRTPVDLLWAYKANYRELSYLVATEVFCWASWTNYQSGCSARNIYKDCGFIVWQLDLVGIWQRRSPWASRF